MKIVLNEQELIHKALESKEFDEKNYGIVLRVLTKHYFLFGMDKQQVKDTLAVHIRERVKKYIHKDWISRIEYAIKNVQKYGVELVNIDKVDITETELQRIKDINDNDIEKIAFVYLVYAKILNKIKSNNDNWVGIKIKDILKDALITKGYKSIREQQTVLRILNDMGLLRSSKKVDNTSERVCFIDYTSDISFSINDFRDYVLTYLRWKGENIGNCETCSKLIQVKSNRKLYCLECWHHREKELKKQWKREHDKNKKVEV
ncbi:hypothetical protein [Paenibacillus thailandensis]|uniref:Uncharacterized protein n=1 Tax=Paenibacillus thailandensis TaxID=393250 RepID=A0ABW5R323_9BACL